MEQILFWVNYLSVYHLQSRKYWQFLKAAECFFLMLEAQKWKLQSATSKTKLPTNQKKQARNELITKARQLQVELRAMEIPQSVRENAIASFVGRFSLTLAEMNQIDDYLEDSELSFVQIAQKMNISRSLLYRYRKNHELYKSKPLLNQTFRRPNTKFG